MPCASRREHSIEFAARPILASERCFSILLLHNANICPTAHVTILPLFYSPARRQRRATEEGDAKLKQLGRAAATLMEEQKELMGRMYADISRRVGKLEGLEGTGTRASNVGPHGTPSYPLSPRSVLLP